ncbi:MAG TPA: DUF4365 domain-containing protein [Actinocrinis sp.]|nr:DUF4365 domain-containing protein [Actinocrinis sp.]
MAEEQLGVHLVGAEIKRWHWVFRDQPVEDYGVDCEAEEPGRHYPTGRLIGIQVKTGKAKYFKSPAADGSGWWYSPGTRRSGEPDRHLRYWLENDRRIVIVLVDETTMPESMYWVHVTLDQVEFTGASWKILVPTRQCLNATAQAEFRAITGAPRAAEQADILAATVSGLPPQTGRILYELRESDHFKALQLAVRLSRGREDPARVCGTLLGRDRRYLDGAGDRLYAALAVYAASHQCPGEVARAFIDAAALGTPGAPGYLALAAWSLIGAGEREQARARIEQAEAAGAPAALCAWIRAVIAHEGPGFPRVPQALLEATRGDPDGSPLYRLFLAHAASTAGDFAGAVRWSEQALAKEPDNSGLMLELARALLVREAANRSPVPGADLTRAVELATVAREQRRRWAGPSEEALPEILRALQMANDFPTALRVATPAPHGEATDREASNPLVAFLGVKIALTLGETDTAALLASRTAPGSPHARAIALMLGEPSPTTAGDAWLALLEDAGDDADLAVYALHRAAATGRWPIDRLERQRAEGQITVEGYEILRARTEAARGDLDAATRTIRPHVPISAAAAESFVEMLEDAEQLDAALEHCEKALERFATTPLAVNQWNLLMRLGRTQEAVDRAVALLARPGFPAPLRTMLRGFLVGEANARRDWRTVEEHCRAALHEAPGQPLFPWMYIGAAYNRRSWSDAWERLEELAPPVTTPQEAGLWLALHAYHGFTEQNVLEALDLFDAFPDDRDVRGQVITTLMTRGNKLGPDGTPILPLDAPGTRPRFQAALDAFLAEGTEGLNVIASRSVQEAFDVLRDGLTARAPLDAYLTECVRTGTMPLVAACVATQVSYPEALLQRSYGPIVAVTQDLADFAVELQDAANSLDRRAIVDASALAVACELPERFPALRGAFADLLIDQQTRFDCLTACSEARQAPGTVSALAVASDGRTLTQVNAPDEEVAAHTARANTLEHLLAPLDTFTELTDESVLRDPARPWLRIVYLALDQQAALWCDDVGLRQEARTLGCPAFGTVALLHALAEAADDDADLRRDVVRLAGAQVADILLEAAELAALAEGHDGFPGPAAAILERSAYWIASPPGAAVDTLLDVLDHVQPPTSDAAAAWIAAVCQGQAAYLDPEDLGPTLAEIAETVARRPGGERDREALLRAAERVADAERAHRTALLTAIGGEEARIGTAIG